MFVQVVQSLDVKLGGPSKSVVDLSTAISNNNQEVNIVTIKSMQPYTNYSFKKVISCSSYNEFIHKMKIYTYENEIKLFHGHGLWLSLVHKMSVIARKNKIPYIVTPRGMLEPWALNASKWKKKIAYFLFQRKDIEKAACIHATAKMEAENIRKLGFINPIAVIPNGLDLNEFQIKSNYNQNGKRTILFLSRIHPKKGIELLIEAWSKIEKKLKTDWMIEIAGNGEDNYIQSLQELIEKKKLQDQIKIIGPVFGEEKIKAYQKADLFVLPTYSENFGIVIAEALASGVPVITTKGTPWDELNTHNSGWWIDIGAEPLVETLNKALILSGEELNQMGLNGRKLVEENYSIESVAEKMIRLYEWILGKGEKPEFLFE